MKCVHIFNTGCAKSGKQFLRDLNAGIFCFPCGFLLHFRIKEKILVRTNNDKRWSRSNKVDHNWYHLCGKIPFFSSFKKKFLLCAIMKLRNVYRHQNSVFLTENFKIRPDNLLISSVKILSNISRNIVKEQNTIIISTFIQISILRLVVIITANSSFYTSDFCVTISFISYYTAQIIIFLFLQNFNIADTLLTSLSFFSPWTTSMLLY